MPDTPVLNPVFSPMSPFAGALSNLMEATFLFLSLIFLLVLFLVGWALIKYRGKPGDPEPPQIFGNNKLEIAWTVVPIIIVIVLFVISLKAMGTSDPQIRPDQKPNIIITGHQWWWEVRYPASGVVTANEVHLPVGQPQMIRLESADVIHDFWVPQLGRKMDAVPGYPNQTWIQADAPGRYIGACAEFCGQEHAWMRILVIAELPDDFAKWQTAQRKVPPTPVSGQAAVGAGFFAQRTCANCHAIAGTTADLSVAPNLTHVSTRYTLAAGALANSPDNLARWLRDPDAFKPQSHMPNLNLSRAEVDALVAYLEGLK